MCERYNVAGEVAGKVAATRFLVLGKGAGLHLGKQINAASGAMFSNPNNQVQRGMEELRKSLY